MIHKLTFGLFSKKDTASFMRLMTYVKPHKSRIILAIIATIGLALTESYLTAFIAPLANKGFQTASNAPPIQEQIGILATFTHIKQQFYHWVWDTEDKVWIAPIFFVLLALFRGIFRFVSVYLMSWVSVVAISQLRQDMFAKMLNMPTKYHQQTQSGEILMNIVQMAENSIGNANTVFITLTRDTLIVIGLVLVLFFLNWQLTLFILIMFPILSGLSRYYRNRLKDIINSSQQSIGSLNNIVNESHQGHQIIKLFAGQQQAIHKFGTINSTLVRLGKKITQANAARSPINELIGAIALAFVIFIALWQSQKGQTTIGEFMAFIVAMIQISGPIKNLAGISIPMQTMFLAADSVCEFMDNPVEKNKGTKKLFDTQGNINFFNVSVQYTEDNHKALDDFNLSIKAGEKVALVGKSGSGKSTLINLLPRFINPNMGDIFLDDINIQDIELNNLRQQFSLVTQDIFLFDDTLFENIRYSNPTASDDDVMMAIKSANLLELVQQLPLGIHQPIGVNGNQLSGGQRQRVSIARAILKNAPILLLDEATSALDNESERLVQKALDNLMHGKTSIIIAHRLSTIRKSDRIIVMNDGKIVEEGSHEQLIKKSGYYATLSDLS